MTIKLLPILPLLALLLGAATITHPVKRTELIAASVVFSIRNAGLAVNGTIGGISADIAFDPDDLDHSHMQATADPATVQTGIGIRDRHLLRSDYFDVKNHPRVQMVSKAFRKTGKNAFTGQFDLTIKEITREVTIPFTAIRKSNAMVYTGEFEVNRLDFNLGEKSPILAEKVKVCIRVQGQVQ